MSSESKVYVVLVVGTLKPGHIDTFVKNFEPLAKYVQDHEEGALTYKLSLGDKDPNKLVIYERYTSKEYLETVHWQSDAFKLFGQKNREAGIEWESKEVTTYYESEVGHMARA
mmetsp:Transcript_32731/g.72305  ORF Transcript_32731/g.72305 Transcript_32731/m.72305 type:complete len:113 (-) Transcript_32731:603-941(-)|eukprot:CAMPEP_0202897646 /NCGR_PEP_ID=MMETSP1392-20130828/6353_1 /ASSEMBLY_ACC=CAM_ASM_000868 /TAXON_ID=225041 /ORGANISM="Chlamydomonas chlamydogama, Strain SAG 11-48b" /LENGTH=112 /DNA_ID=CAMNT_0049583333 /DNA_START=83 /DNA_END=421 /DNA_ORIENTATION=-